jgi:hypothetical protein
MSNWVSLLDQVQNVNQRKLFILGIVKWVSFMGVPSDMSSILSICIDALHDVKESIDGDAPIYWQHEVVMEDETCAEQVRRKLNSKRDLIHSVSLVSALHMFVCSTGSKIPIENAEKLHSLEAALKTSQDG